MKWSPSQVLEYGNILHYLTKQYAMIMVLTHIFASLLLANLCYCLLVHLLFISHCICPIIYPIVSLFN